MTPSLSAPPQILAAFDAQLAYTLNGVKEGSPAIALGRTAGLAQMIGLPAVANTMWSELEKLPKDTTRPSPSVLGKLPSLEQLHNAYQANPNAFAAFADPQTFPAGGTAFSNAIGSYAFALDYIGRGNAAIAAGGDPKWVGHWGAQTLAAAGFAAQAAQLERLVAQKTAEISGPH